MTQFIKRTLLFLLIVLACGNISIHAQNYDSESDLKKAAEEFFENEEYEKAIPLYSQLVSLYEKDPFFNYRYGSSLLMGSEDKKEPLVYLKFAASKPDVDPDAYYFLGKAYHLNYRFHDAMVNYRKFKENGNKKVVAKRQIDNEITMCENGMELMKDITDLVVYSKQNLNEEDFFRVYQLDEFGGKLIVKPEEFMSEYEKKNDIRTIMYLQPDAERMYFSMYDDKGTNRDIYFVDKMVSGEFGKPIPLGSSINTQYDEDFPFAHPDGKSLFFASKGHNSMGGYDIFKSVYTDENGWSSPKNLDFAINTPNDDYLLITNLLEDKAYFTSNRYSKQGKVNVYEIGMKRIPIQLATVQGQFAGPESNNAKITIEDASTNTVIGQYQTDSKGNYAFRLPNNGKFKFFIEAEESNLAHTGMVDLNNHDPLKPFFQEMKLINEGGDEKLIIKNLIDKEGEFDTETQVELFANQANLEVNFDEVDLSNVVAAETTDEEIVESTGPTLELYDEHADGEGKHLDFDATFEDKDIANQESVNTIDSESVESSENNSSEERSNESSVIKTSSSDTEFELAQEVFQNATENELITLSNTDVALLRSESKQFEENAATSREKGDAKKRDAFDLQAQLDKLNASPNKDDESTQQEINKLEKEIAQNNIEAEGAYNLAETFEKKAIHQNNLADKNEAFAKEISQFQTTGTTDQNTFRINSIRDSLAHNRESISADPGKTEIVYEDIQQRIKKVEIEKKQEDEYLAALETTYATDEAELENLKTEIAAEKNKKKKAEISEQLVFKTNMLNTSKSDITNAKVNVEKKESEIQALNAELSMVTEIVQESNPELSKAEIEKGISGDYLAQSNSEINSPSNTQINEDVSKLGAESAINPQMVNNENAVKENDLVTQSLDKQTEDSSNDESNGESVNNINNENLELLNTGNTADNSELTIEDIDNSNYELPIPSEEDFVSTGGDLYASTSKSTVDNESESGGLVEKDVYVELTGVTNEGKYFPKLQALDNVLDPISRETQKGEVLDNWASELNSDAFLLKLEKKKATRDEKKEELDMQIAGLEEQEKLIKDMSAQSYAVVAQELDKKYTADAEANPDLNSEIDFDTPEMQQKIDQQSLSNVMVSSYNKDFSNEFNKASVIENDYVRVFKTKDINERWLQEISKETSELALRVEATEDVELKRLMEERLKSLNQLKSLKEAEVTQLNRQVGSIAFQTANEDVPPAQGKSIAAANYKAHQSKLLLQQSVELADSSSKVQDETLKNKLNEEANDTYESARKLAMEAESIYAEFSEDSFAQNTTKKYTSRSDMVTARKERTAKEKAAIEAANPQNQSLTQQNNASKRVQGASVDLTTLNESSPYTINNQLAISGNNSKLVDLNYKNDSLSKALNNESNPTKKAQIEDEIAVNKDVLLRRTKQAELLTEYNDKAIKAEQNAILGRSNTALLEELKQMAANLEKQANDTLEYAEILRQEAEMESNPEKKRKMLRDAAIMNERSKVKLEEAENITHMALGVENAEFSASQKNLLKTTASEFSFPTVSKTLSDAEVQQVTSSKEYQEYLTLKEDYRRLVQEAQVMYTQSAEQKKSAESDLMKAKELREQAIFSTDLSEKRRLIKEAIILEKLAQEKMKESMNKEDAANELTNNANNKKQEVEAFITNLNPAISEMIIAYETESSTVVSSGDLANSNGTQGSNSELSNKTKSGSINVEGGKIEVSFDPVNKSLFAFTADNTPYYNEAQPIPMNPDMPEGLVYKVQVGAFKNRIPPETFRGFAPITGERTANGLTRFTAGMFEEYNGAKFAKDKLRNLGYKDAFIVAYYNGKRVTNTEARDMKKWAGAQSANLQQYADDKGLPSAKGSAKYNESGSSTSPSSGSTASSGSSSSAGSPSTDGKVYTVQVGAFKGPVGDDRYAGISNLIENNGSDGLTRYQTGKFNSPNEAKSKKDQLIAQGFSDAFVTEYRGGNSTSGISKGKSIPKTNSSSPSSTSSLGKASFKVQVGAYKTAVPIEVAKAILNLSKHGLDYQELGNGITIYVIGNYSNYDEANKVKDEVVAAGLTDAFVAAFRNGKKISIQEALKK